jgi:hypothetical protein
MTFVIILFIFIIMPSCSRTFHIFKFAYFQVCSYFSCMVNTSDQLRSQGSDGILIPPCFCTFFHFPEIFGFKRQTLIFPRALFALRRCMDRISRVVHYSKPLYFASMN